MNDRPRDDDEQSASDWLAEQFGGRTPETDGEPATAPPAPVPPASAPPAPVPPASAPPASVPPASVPPATTPPAAAPPAPATPSEPPAADGFSWGLRPAASEAAPTPEPPAPVPPPLVEPPAPADVPTVAWTPPPLEPSLDGAEPPAAPPPAAMPFETARLPEVAPDAEDAPSWDIPTQMMDAVAAEPEPEPSAAPPVPAPQPSMPPQVAGELAATEMLGSAAIGHDASSTSALEALFAEENFRDYVADPDPAQAPFARARAEAPASASAPPHRGDISRTQKILLGVAGGLVLVLALLALFLLGTRLGSIAGAAPQPTASGSPSASPSPSSSATALPAGPVEPGVWAWDELLGGECLDPFEGPWAEEFTVVDCAEPHPAQLVFRGVLLPAVEGTTSEPFPGAEELQTRVQTLCAAAGVVDLAAAGAYTDLQVQGTYPPTVEQWDAGERSYFCVVTRSSGEPLAGSVAVAPAPAG